jgi:hypothetical protein
MEAKDSIQSDHSKVRRIPDRGHYDLPTIYSILDAHCVCQIAFVHEGRPQIIPTLYGRRDNQILFHGAALSRMLAAAQSQEICLSVTVLDAFVLARSAFHHSANYRSVVLYGKPQLVEGEAEKMAALAAISNHFLPGRWEECREPNAQELKATLVLSLEIEEGAAKVRDAGPKDDPRDMDLDHWAGLLPIQMKVGEPEPANDLKQGLSLPESIRSTQEKWNGE